jgi:hypothetical protein
MKNLALLVIAIFSITSLNAQKVFYPSKPGTKLTYQSNDDKGKQVSKSIYTVKEINGSGSNYTVVYTVESLDKKDKLVFKDEIKVRQEGDNCYFDMSNYLNKAAFQQNGEIPATVEVTGNNMELPVIPVPGTPLPDADVTMSLKMGFMNLKTSILVTNRKVEAIEDITVPAGNFNAFKFSSDVHSTIMGLKVSGSSKEWYAYGVGIVKSESYDKNGKLTSTMELIELSK